MKKIVAIEIDIDEDAFGDDELLSEVIRDQLEDVGPVRSAALILNSEAVMEWFRDDWVQESLQVASEQEMSLDHIEEIGGENTHRGWMDWIGEMTIGTKKRKELAKKIQEMMEDDS